MIQIVRDWHSGESQRHTNRIMMMQSNRTDHSSKGRGVRHKINTKSLWWFILNEWLCPPDDY